MPNGTKTRSGTARIARRREELRRTLPKQTFDIKALLQHPEFINAALVTMGFFIVLSTIMVWSRDQLKAEIGQVMTDTRLKRLDYREPDLATTEQRRDEAGKSAPHIYTLNSLDRRRGPGRRIHQPRLLPGAGGPSRPRGPGATRRHAVRAHRARRL